MKTLSHIASAFTFILGSVVVSFVAATGSPVAAVGAALVTILATAGMHFLPKLTIGITAAALAVALGALGSGVEATIAGLFCLGLALVTVERRGVSGLRPR
jgi:hypothetical protein